MSSATSSDISCVINQPTPKASSLQIKPKLIGADRRDSERIEIRQSEGVDADVQLADGTWLTGLQVYDISLSGICLVLPLNQKEAFAIGGQFKVLIKCRWGHTYEGDYSISWLADHDKSEFRAGLHSLGNSRVKDFVARPDSDEVQIRIPEEFPVTGYVYKDFFYIERAPFQIISIGIKNVTITISESEVLLYPGMMMELIFSFRSSTGQNIGCEVQRVEIINRHKVEVVAEITAFPKTLQFDLVNHLLQNTTVTPETIKAAGLSTKSIANNFRYRFVKTQKEYLQVLKLRRTAYSLAGKVDQESDLEKLAAPLDPISRILAVYHGTKIIGSVAMSFPEKEDVQLDTQRALKEGYPASFPKKSSVIEISRLCTDPDYRRGDLLLRIFEHIYKVFVTTGRDYLLTSTDNSLWPIYKNLGFKKTGYSYPHPFLSGIEHHIIIIEKSLPMRSRHFNPLKWNYLYRDMTDHLISRMDLRYSLFDRLKLKLYRKIGKIFKIRSKQKY